MTREKLIDAIETVAEAARNRFGDAVNHIRIYGNRRGGIANGTMMIHWTANAADLAAALLPPPPPNPCEGRTLAELPRDATYERQVNDGTRLRVRISQGGQICDFETITANDEVLYGCLTQQDLTATDWQPCVEGGAA